MLKDFLDSLVQLINRAHCVKEHHPQDEPSGRYLLTMPDGSVTVHDAEVCQMPRILSIRDLVEWTAVGTEPEFWFNRKEIVGIRMKGVARDYATYPMTYTPQFLTASSLSQQSFDQKGFINLLRVALCGCGPFDLIHKIRKVTFQHQQVQTGRIDPAKASLGKQLEASMTAVEELPEYIDLEIPIWNEHGIADKIRCALDINLETSKFAIIPLPGQLEKLLQEGEMRLMLNIKAELDNAAVIAPVYYGLCSNSNAA